MQRPRAYAWKYVRAAIPLDGVAPLRDLPFEFDRPLEGGLRQVDLDAVARGLDVSDVDKSGQRRRPQPGQRSAAGVERQMVFAVEPAWRHHPGVLVVHVALLRMRVRVLVPRVPSVETGLPRGSRVTNIS